MPQIVSADQVGFNPRGAGTFKLPFEEQLQFFAQKRGNLIPTQHYDDVLRSTHDRGFMVAGAAKADLLADFYNAVNQAIAEGKSIHWFRQQFDTIVAKHGWDYTGPRDWRTRVIYQTNLSASYAAGRWAQLTDPDLLKLRPYWRYVHNDTVLHPRELHLAWNGLTLRYDHPWWQTHYPPNGYGCRCRVTAVAKPTPGREVAPDDGTWTKVDRWGETHVIPKGIDYGWDYAPGNAWSGKLMMDKAATLPAPIGARAVQAARHSIGLLQEVGQQYRRWVDNIDTAKPRGERFVVGALTPETVDFLAAQGMAPQTAAISLGDAQYAHFHRDFKTAQLPTWLSAELPERLAAPLAVLWDVQGESQGKPPALIYVFHAPGTGAYAKIVVQLGYQTKDKIAGRRERIVTNAVVTAGLVGIINLTEQGAYQLLSGQWPE